MKIYRIIRTFFRFFGTQNDYLYPFEGQINAEGCPFERPHWWKTRIGFDTAWRLTRVIHKF